jgi:peptidyl-prolyl cis-trans isomerase A (cyclophilin A)
MSVCCLVVFAAAILYVFIRHSPSEGRAVAYLETELKALQKSYAKGTGEKKHAGINNNNIHIQPTSSISNRTNIKNADDDNCPYSTLQELTQEERFPTASATRHIVSPPQETLELGVTLVCCSTTQGPLEVLVHHSWAPNGARRFLDMVEAQYFDTTVPLMRCVHGFLCQFGLNGVPEAMQPFQSTIPDDPNWLPEGPDHRQNDLGVKRFQKGYMAYAGSGKNSRNIQLIVALGDNGPLGGGSPWEVPFAEVVGGASFETLSKIYTGYGEKGPSQGLLHKAKALDIVHRDFPHLDYVQKCHVVDREAGQGIPGSTRNIQIRRAIL